MATKKTILITGATGYIGGSVLSHFLQRPDHGSFEFRALIRSVEKAEKIKAFGVTPIVGSASDGELMFKAASEADIVIALTNCDDLDAAEAILAGLKKRYETTGERPILIHTSGAANLIDNSDGDHPSDFIYDDDNAAQIESIPLNNPHRHVDTRIAAAGQEGYVYTYIVVPSIVYGIAQNLLVDAGISNPSVLFANIFIPIALQRGDGFRIGEGKNIWGHIEINELVDLYSRVFDAVSNDPKNTPNGREGYYFANSNEHRLIEIYKILAEVFYEQGKGKSPEPTPLTKEELDRFFGDSPIVKILFSNSRCVGNRARRLGWKPQKTHKDYLESFRKDVEGQIQKSTQSE
ncbi:hypothetical protein VNI00_008475 [Paramarasmius palmivorus]|uniref:NmrA-like domain-containing protein n=1 Tax=Paramarasmius palmivorus TaxID=297713 RepID=A0AAW0CW68_9AGAR